MQWLSVHIAAATAQTIIPTPTKALTATLTATLTAMLSMMVLVAPASAVTISTGPTDWQWGYDGTFTGGDVAGGVFNPAGNRLSSFSLTVGGGSGTNDLRAVVLEVAGGVPIGNLVWESASFSATFLAEVIFSPDLSLNPFSQYYIGIDSGLLTTATGGDFVVGVTGDIGQFPGGVYWDNTDDFFSPGFTQQTGLITTTMEFVTNPEPTSLSLLSLGLVGLGAVQRRRFRGRCQ